MAKESEVRPLFLFLDIVQGAINETSFFEYIKSSLKKNVCFVNAYDFADKAPSRMPKSSSRDLLNVTDDNTLIKNLKTRIETEILRIKTLQAQIVPEPVKEPKPKPKSSKKRPSKSRTPVVEPPKPVELLFGGAFDVLFIITNFPYRTEQVNELFKEGLSPMIFAALLPENEDPVPTEFNLTDSFKLSNTYPRKAPISGSILDFTVCPNCYPPARWVALQDDIQTQVPFIEIKCGSDNDITFNKIEESVIKTAKGITEYQKIFGNTKFTKIPIASDEKINIDGYKEYIKHSKNDFINALYYQLKKYGFNAIPEGEEVIDDEKYNKLFYDSYDTIMRKVTYVNDNTSFEKYFDFDRTKFSLALYKSIYDSFKWKYDEIDAAVSNAILNFINSPTNMYCYAGQKFEYILSHMNKKYNLGLHMQSFDWEKQIYFRESKKPDEFLDYILETACLVETLFEKETGLIWVVAMEPVTKQVGHEIRKEYFPPTINGVSEYVKTFYDKEIPPEEKKPRNPPSIASKLRSNESVLDLLKRPLDALKEEKNIYDLPVKVSQNVEARSEFLFESGVIVRVNRDVINSEPTLSIDTLIGCIHFHVLSDTTFEFAPMNNLRFIKYPDKTSSIIFNNQSIFFNGKDFYIKSFNKDPIIITEKGTMITKISPTEKRFCFENGTIATFNETDNKWIFIDKGGVAIERTFGENASQTPLNLQHSCSKNMLTGVTKMIRPDNIEYYIKNGGEREIILGKGLIVKHAEKTISFEIPKMPIINFNRETGEFSINIDIFNIKINKEEQLLSVENVKIAVNNVTNKIEVSTGSPKMPVGMAEMSFDQKEEVYQFKSDDSILVVSKAGEQRVGKVDTSEKPKKKVNYIQSKWGNLIPVKETLNEQQQVALQDMFIPHFFLINNDLSYCEYKTYDSIEIGEQVVRKGTVDHPSGESFNFISLHGICNKMIYVVHKGLSKIERANIMKNLHIPKKKQTSKSKQKKDKDVDYIKLANNAYNQLKYTSKIFHIILSDAYKQENDEYIKSIFPEEEEAEEPPRIPPHTPNPAILNMMQVEHEPTIVSSTSNKHGRKLISYWELHESDFAYPNKVERKNPRPVSARRMLNDPPRFFEPEPPQRDEEEEDFQITRVAHPRLPKTARTITKPICITDNLSKLIVTPKVVNFGEVKVGNEAKIVIHIKNVSKNPVHYSQFEITPQDPNIEVKTLPGAIMPGLRKSFTVYLHALQPQKLSSYISVKTDFGQLRINIDGEILE